MKRREVVTCFLRRPDGKVLLLRRSDRVQTYPGKWAGVSGSFAGEDPETGARREILEETGLGPPSVHLARRGDPMRVFDPQLAAEWIVHPFLFDVAPGAEPTLNWENEESRWVDPDEIERYPHVPALPETLRKVL
ncbi:MAG TPA: NUDIX pyrophosphatase [Candidatus Thermoplasmatota archaeon]|nr:NUDIX pyrophosphatase [Candidatus Thermoplasmatota archaeon]